MRITLGLALAFTMASGAFSADLGDRYYEPDEAVIVEEAVRHPAPRRIVKVKRSTCVGCSGSRLPLGGLRETHVPRLPYGGLGTYCPPELQTRQVVLRRKG
jgi:hypothetical protein